jgi:hypothetical protein
LNVILPRLNAIFPRLNAILSWLNAALPWLNAVQILSTIDADMNAATEPTGFKCELMAVNPKQIADVFGERACNSFGQAELTSTRWNMVVHPAVVDALTGAQPKPVAWYSPAVGIRAAIPPGSTSGCPAGQYVILMFFEDHSTELYFNGKRMSGGPAISDNHPWRDILTNAGISLAPAASSSK